MLGRWEGCDKAAFVMKFHLTLAGERGGVEGQWNSIMINCVALKFMIFGSPFCGVFMFLFRGPPTQPFPSSVYSLRWIFYYILSFLCSRMKPRPASFTMLFHSFAHHNGMWKIRKQFNLHIIEAHKHLFRLIIDFRLTRRFATQIHHRNERNESLPREEVWIIDPITMSFHCHPSSQLIYFHRRVGRMQSN